MARTLQEAGQPVCLMIPRVDFLEGTAYEGCTAWGSGPDATRNGQVRQWPCLALARPELTVRWLRGQLQPFQDAKIRVHAVLLDDECLPHPWNGCYEAQRDSTACRQAYPPGVLDRFDAFRTWADNFRAKLSPSVPCRSSRCSRGPWWANMATWSPARTPASASMS